MKITFLGATHEVTGSMTYIEVGRHRLLVDCGMEQGKDIYVNQTLPVSAKAVDAVFLTHAHIDHSGKLPLLTKEGFAGQIHSTDATADLCDIMLRDSAHIQEFEAEWRNRKNARSNRDHVEPLYTLADAEGVLPLFEPCGYSLKVDINDDLSVRFTEAGHLLGSSAVELWIRENKEERKLVFSGDLGNGNRP
jgi:metallo-beta-lactamase family protein